MQSGPPLPPPNREKEAEREKERAREKAEREKERLKQKEWAEIDKKNNAIRKAKYEQEMGEKERGNERGKSGQTKGAGQEKGKGRGKRQGEEKAGRILMGGFGPKKQKRRTLRKIKICAGIKTRVKR